MGGDVMGPVEARLRTMDPTLGVYGVLWESCEADINVLRGAALWLGFEDPVVKGEPWVIVDAYAGFRHIRLQGEVIRIDAKTGLCFVDLKKEFNPGIQVQGPCWLSQKSLKVATRPESSMVEDKTSLEVVGPAPVKPPCSFCGEPNACAVHVSGLRCQSEPWHYCDRVGCCESIDLHVSRLENGLVDCSETRAATRAWYLAKVEREAKEAREARLARMVP